MRTLGVVTVARSDYGIYLPLLRRIEKDRSLRLHLFVGGSHWWKEQGETARVITADGFTIGSRVKTPFLGDSTEAAAREMGAGVDAFARAFRKNRPDLLVVLGDRFDMIAAALAALPFRIPVAHIHGGEVTRGAMDDALRHAMTKLSHLHFATTEAYARRIRQLGEEPWRVFVSGAPSLDQLKSTPWFDAAEIRARWGLDVRRPFLLATFHPSTLEAEDAGTQVERLLEAVDASGFPALFTLANADPGGRAVERQVRRFAATRPSMICVDTLGIRGYWSVLRHAAAMVGNSSSGILEAPSFALPVVNIGRRQEGRVRARNVIDVPCERGAILRGIRKATSSAFRSSLRGLVNPYAKGRAAEIILRVLKRVPLDERLILKRFVDR